MIEADRRKAVYLLGQEGVSISEISRKMRISRKAVRKILKQKGEMPDTIRADKIKVDIELLQRLYNQCEGYVQRIHEKLIEEENIKIGYSTLTRLVKDLNIGSPESKRSGRVPDQPGVEMQNDTSPYNLKIGDKTVKVIGCILYFRYSKCRYLKFYRSFNRFRMKCFFHEALTYWKYSAKDCIIDNTNLARLRGTGKNAVIVPEMEQFARQYGFRFICHEVKHSNRKAGNERSFWTVETNFFPGRTFESMEDLNRQALEWATVRMFNRPVARTGLIPAKAFEYEKPYLVKLPPFIPAPYQPHTRDIDQYGYIVFDANFYWIPKPARGRVAVLQYSTLIKIYQKRKLLSEYNLPAEDVRNKIFKPEGFPDPEHKPHNRKKPTATEEKRLRAISKEVNIFLDSAVKTKGKKKHQFIRGLFDLSQKIGSSLFIDTIKRALKYGVTDIKSIERIAILKISDGQYEIPFVDIDENFQNRENYIEGYISEKPDLKIYEQMMGEKSDGC